MTVTLDIENPAVLTLLQDMERLNLVRVKDPLPADADPAAPEPPRRNRADMIGSLKGQIWIAEDFDAPMELKEYM